MRDSRVFDATFQLVLPSQRTLSILEDVQKQKAIARERLKLTRQTLIARYKLKIEAALRKRVDSPRRAESKRKVMEPVQVHSSN